MFSSIDALVIWVDIYHVSESVNVLARLYVVRLGVLMSLVIIKLYVFCALTGVQCKHFCVWCTRARRHVHVFEYINILYTQITLW